MSHSSDCPLLDTIQGPADVKKLKAEELDALAAEIRHKLVHSISRTGGHLGPNLGVVELSIALHRVFNTPADKFVFDVSHQGYVHKMLTGRNESIHTIRQYEGLNGFLLRTESEHDIYGAGHAGTALSAALGMAVARDLSGGDENVVCVAGDAAFTCGPTFEALNNIGSTKRLIVVLNDNEWSIDKNVGAIARYLNHLATNKAYSAIRHKAAEFVEKVAGKMARRIAHRIEEGAKNVLLPSVIFEEFGLRYFGPIDGHDIATLVHSFEFLKTLNEPVILHIITEKGRGYEPALANPGKFHGLGPYQIETGETPTTALTASDVFARSVTDFAKQDKSIVAITAAMPGGTKLEIFKKEIPERYFDVGIAEEHAALFACGLATRGLKPFLAIYSTFMQRAYDMIIHDMAIQQLPVRLCMDRGGLSGDDGPTHHGLFDIGYLRHVPNLVHMQPRNENELADMLWTMACHEEGPIAIRYPRGPIAGTAVKAERTKLEIGKAEVLVGDGNDVALFGLGTFFSMAEETRQALEQAGIRASLINPRFIKPLDTAVLEKFARQCKVIATFEDHVLHNGFGCSVIEHLHEAGIHTPVIRLGWPDEFIEHGTVPILREKHGLTPGHAVARIKAQLEALGHRPSGAHLIAG
ncbi:MAG: 1-deoxy-D-xylulose-5-phosphate synthase [Verrucomicrobiales bacterium]